MINFGNIGTEFKMKLNIIGTGSSGNCYLIEDSQKNSLMIECGVRIDKVKKALNFDFSKVEGCFISHEHQDHCEFFMEVEKCGVLCFTNKTYNLLENIFCTPSYTIESFSLEHDVENIGFLIYSVVERKRLLYITDTKFVRWKFEIIDYLMVECNYDNDSLDRNIGKYQGELLNRIVENHMSLSGVLEFLRAQELDLKHVVLIHKSESNLNDELAKEEISKLLCATQLSIAKNGMEIML
jgi:phosphoribosyl 1,2-cyclic phosphodiesterase